MTAKHNGKRARENIWVMQQNKAKAKGGRPPFRPKAPRVEVVQPKVTPPVDDTGTEISSTDGKKSEVD